MEPFFLRCVYWHAGLCAALKVLLDELNDSSSGWHFGCTNVHKTRAIVATALSHAEKGQWRQVFDTEAAVGSASVISDDEPGEPNTGRGGGGATSGSGRVPVDGARGSGDDEVGCGVVPPTSSPSGSDKVCTCHGVACQ
jgi:hypothetical protein